MSSIAGRFGMPETFSCTLLLVASRFWSSASCAGESPARRTAVSALDMSLLQHPFGLFVRHLFNFSDEDVFDGGGEFDSRRVLEDRAQWNLDLERLTQA